MNVEFIDGSTISENQNGRLFAGNMANQVMHVMNRLNLEVSDLLDIEQIKPLIIKTY